MITRFGKRFLTDFIAGNRDFSKKELAFGISTNAEYALSDSNSRLGFEFYRTPVLFGGIDIDTSVTPYKYTAIYSTKLPPNLAGKINEVALYPGQRSSVNYYDNKFITDFELPYEWTPTPTIDQDNYRVGNSSLVFESNGTSAREYVSTIENLDISGYSNFDTISFSYKVNNASLSNVKIRLYSSLTDYYEFTVNGHSVGWNIKNLALSQMTVSGSPIKSEINRIGIVVTPTTSATSIIVDGLRINDEDTFDPVYGMIARSNITEVEKIAGRELLITYKLDLNFGA